MHWKTGKLMNCQLLNVVGKCEVYIRKKIYHLILDMLPHLLVPAKELICVINFL